MSAYKDFCKSMEMQSLEACLLTDLRVSLTISIVTVVDTVIASTTVLVNFCVDR